jgi:hypothetical protein
MQIHRHPNKRWRAIFCGGLMAAVAAAGWAEDGRFSQQLTPVERADLGLPRLSSDQLAVLDALIRRDEKWYVRPDAKPPSPARFSQRLSAGERQSAGLELLDETHLERLDALVARSEFGSGPDAAFARSSETLLRPEFRRPAPEIHGMISFTFGGGSGYSAMGGAMALEFDDPAHGFSILAGYEQMRFKGPLLGRGYGYYGDPYYRGPVDAFLQPGR